MLRLLAQSMKDTRPEQKFSSGSIIAGDESRVARADQQPPSANRFEAKSAFESSRQPCKGVARLRWKLAANDDGGKCRNLEKKSKSSLSLSHSLWRREAFKD